MTPADVATARKGGPLPLIARMQPFMVPAMIAGAGVALIVLIAIVYLVSRSRRSKAAA